MPFPAEVWKLVCGFLAENATCQVVIHQHQGVISKVDFGLTKETLYVRHGNIVHTDRAPVYGVATERLDKQ
jgi:hypothetical protein